MEKICICHLQLDTVHVIHGRADLLCFSLTDLSLVPRSSSNDQMFSPDVCYFQHDIKVEEAGHGGSVFPIIY